MDAQIRFGRVRAGSGDGSGVGPGVTTAPAHVTEMAEFVCHSDPVHSLHVPDTAVRSSSAS